jgi:GrpB-like predicted nucleotidyltransferase (UPF0157 family)
MEEPAPSHRRSERIPPPRIEIVAYDPAWPGRFAGLGRELRDGLGDVALRIDHIGSTSVPGLAAKPIIDIQVSVAAFDPLEAFRTPLERLDTRTALTTPSGPSGTSGSPRVTGEPISMCAGRVASRSSGPCCSGTTCAPTVQWQPSMRR